MEIDQSEKIPEHEMLLVFATNLIGKDKIPLFSPVTRDQIDWDYFISAARYHRLIPLIYDQIITSRERIVPQAVVENLRQIFLQTVQLNMLMTSELLSLHGKLTSQGIPLIPYKGPVLAQVLYGDFTRRSYDDLDILVHREDIPKICKILIDEGYQLEHPLTKSQESAFLKSGHHHRFCQGQLGFIVEIHWEFSQKIYSFQPDMQDVWKHAHPIAMAGRQVLSLSNEDMLLILCEHGARHYWKRLSWICDIAGLVGSSELDWSLVLKAAKQSGSERVLLLGISLARTVFHVDVPMNLSERCCEDPDVERLTKLAVNRIFCEKVHPLKMSEIPALPDINEELFYLQARERWTDRTLYYLRRAITPDREDWNYLVLPDFLAPLYPFVRIRRLMGKYKLGILKWIMK